jgi:uncharacterized protein (TIGR00730 family)
MAARGIGLVYGGGSIGLMGVLADAILEVGGEAIGVIPEVLKRPEVAHEHLSELHVVSGMHPRKAMMAQLGDAFAVLPGGFGTLDELFEALTWAQLRIHAKPIGILNLGGYFDPLRAFVSGALAEGFIDTASRDLLVWADDPEELVALLAERARPS